MASGWANHVGKDVYVAGVTDVSTAGGFETSACRFVCVVPFGDGMVVRATEYMPTPRGTIRTR